MDETESAQLRDEMQITEAEVCPICKTILTIKKGFRYTQNRGKIQKKICRECGSQFSNECTYTHRMRMPDHILIFILGSYIKGDSTRYIQKRIAELYGITISHSAIANYINRFKKS